MISIVIDIIRTLQFRKKGQWMTVIKVIGAFLLLLAILFATWKIVSWLRGPGEEAVTSTSFLGG